MVVKVKGYNIQKTVSEKKQVSLPLLLIRALIPLNTVMDEEEYIVPGNFLF